MGVINLFSSDSRDNKNKYYNGKDFCPIGQKSFQKKFCFINNISTPDPTNFKIIKQEIINGYPLLFVNYPNVENYEGNKILLYPKNFNLDIIKKRMDPHFFTEKDSPIARFEPTEYGWNLACILIKNLE